MESYFVTIIDDVDVQYNLYEQNVAWFCVEQKGNKM